LPVLDSTGHWTINTISELFALAQNPDINIDNLIKDVTNLLKFARSYQYLSSQSFQWKDDGLETITAKVTVIS
jgi:hypothetical protein